MTLDMYIPRLEESDCKYIIEYLLTRKENDMLIWYISFVFIARGMKNDLVIMCSLLIVAVAAF